MDDGRCFSRTWLLRVISNRKVFVTWNISGVNRSVVAIVFSSGQYNQIKTHKRKQTCKQTNKQTNTKHTHTNTSYMIFHFYIVLTLNYTNVIFFKYLTSVSCSPWNDFLSSRWIVPCCAADVWKNPRSWRWRCSKNGVSMSFPYLGCNRNMLWAGVFPH